LPLLSGRRPRAGRYAPVMRCAPLLARLLSPPAAAHPPLRSLLPWLALSAVALASVAASASAGGKPRSPRWPQPWSESSTCVGIHTPAARALGIAPVQIATGGRVQGPQNSNPHGVEQLALATPVAFDRDEIDSSAAMVVPPGIVDHDGPGWIQPAGGDKSTIAAAADGLVIRNFSQTETEEGAITRQSLRTFAFGPAGLHNVRRYLMDAPSSARTEAIFPFDVDGDRAPELVVVGPTSVGVFPGSGGKPSWAGSGGSCESSPALVHVPASLNGGVPLLVVVTGGCGAEEAQAYEWRGNKLVARKMGRLDGREEYNRYVPRGLCVVPDGKQRARLAMTYFDRDESGARTLQPTLVARPR
jgi:hypothetical protein